MQPSIFDKEVNFTGLLSKKWDTKEAKSSHPDILPLWIADMDFPTAPAITEAIIKYAKHGVYGYPKVQESYISSVLNWFKTEHGWSIDASHIVQVPGVVTALHTIIGAMSDEGDGVIIQTPSYPPFARTINEMKRIVKENPLTQEEDGYGVNFDHLELLLKEEKTKIFILCNPHNPVGKVFTQTELAKITTLCARHKVFVIADELHCDIRYSEATHISFHTVSEEAKQLSAACTAPSKTFSLAGLKNSNIIIPNAEVRDKVEERIKYFGIPHPALFPLVAGEAAYEHSKEWQHDCVAYLQANRDFALDFLAQHCPKIHAIKPLATYFLWLDFSTFNLTPEDLERKLYDDAGVWLNHGQTFGVASQKFFRLNFACPRSRLTEALQRVCSTFATL